MDILEVASAVEDVPPGPRGFVVVHLLDLGGGLAGHGAADPQLDEGLAGGAAGEGHFVPGAGGKDDELRPQPGVVLPDHLGELVQPIS